MNRTWVVNRIGSPLFAAVEIVANDGDCTDRWMGGREWGVLGSRGLYSHEIFRVW